jgi:uncharacterized protein with PIN domain
MPQVEHIARRDNVLQFPLPTHKAFAHCPTCNRKLAARSEREIDKALAAHLVFHYRAARSGGDAA